LKEEQFATSNLAKAFNRTSHHYPCSVNGLSFLKLVRERICHSAEDQLTTAFPARVIGSPVQALALAQDQGVL
jgi:hypothetical protein